MNEKSDRTDAPDAPDAPAPPPLLEAMLGVHELFVTMCAAGFSEGQACMLLGSWMAAQGIGGSGNTG